MLTHPTLDQMAALGLTGMAAAWRALAEQDPGEALGRNEWLGLMLDREAAHRADTRFANRLRNARMRFPNACIEDIDFAAPRGLDRRQILSLAQGGWLKAHEQIILTGQTGTGQTGTGQTGTGQTGTGKTWLACAFAHQAARMDQSVAYARMPRLFDHMATARLDGRFPRLIDKLARVQLLVLDDWGTQPERSAAPRPARALRGKIPAPLHQHHRPAACLRPASDDRRAHHRRRHPRPRSGIPSDRWQSCPHSTTPVASS